MMTSTTQADILYDIVRDRRSILNYLNHTYKQDIFVYYCIHIDTPYDTVVFWEWPDVPMKVHGCK
jgi:hypothetical protein